MHIISKMMTIRTKKKINSSRTDSIDAATTMNFEIDIEAENNHFVMKTFVNFVMKIVRKVLRL
jgi:hypothetical protein